MFAINTNGHGEMARQVAEPERIRNAGMPGTPAGAAHSLAADPIGYALGFLKRRFPSLALMSLAGLGIGVALAVITPNRYSATTQLLIDPRDLRVLQNEISPQSMGSDATTTYLESQARVISSDSIKRKVIDKLGLDKDPDFGGPRGGLRQMVGLDSTPARDPRDPVLVALAAMDKQVIVRRGDRTFVIDITTISGDGSKSARIANTMAETYLEDQVAVRSDSAQRASASLTGRLSELRERVRIAEDKVEKYRAANNLVGTSGKLVTDEQLAVGNTQFAQARARSADAQAKFDQVRIVRPSSVEAGATPEALNSASIAAFRAQLGSALTREADALVLYGAQHPALVSAQAQVRDARRQIAEELARTVQAARAELDRARAAETSIGTQVERLKRDTLATSQAAVQLRELERDADASRQVYQAFLLRARETSEQSGVDSTNARVITAAVAPLEKMGPNRKLFAVFGLLSGLAAGFAFGLLRDVLMGRRRGLAAASGDASPATAAATNAAPVGQPAEVRLQAGVDARPSMSRPAQAETSAQASTRGVVPFAARPDDKAGNANATAAAGPSRWRGFASPKSSNTTEAQKPGGPLHVTLPAPTGNGGWRRQPAQTTSAFHGTGFVTDAWDQPKSAFAMAIGQIRDRLALEEKLGSNRKVVVLGLAPGAGTSLVALNLALAAAREKATPILIDLAGGPSSLSAGFAGDAEIGAEDVISGAAGLIRAALQDDETGAFFLPRPAGAQRRPAPCPARLKSGLFDQTRRFEAVIVDAGSTADGALPYQLAELADDIVVVAPAAMAPEAALRLLQRSLGSDADKVRAVIQNQAAKG
ncbi:MAG: exopolysaccharide transport family protein [Bosea sp. (in: a-proteobacteria)]